ncbi:hypothetical protein [Litoreibacter albidus]
MDDQVLFDAVFTNTGEEFCVVGRTRRNFAHIEQAKFQLIERDQAEVLGHCDLSRGGASSFGSRQRLLGLCFGLGFCHGFRPLGRARMRLSLSFQARQSGFPFSGSCEATYLSKLYEVCRDF